MRNLKQNTCSVAGHFICACCAAVVQVYQYFFAVFDYRMVFCAVDVNDCPYTAGIVLTPDFVKPLVFLSHYFFMHCLSCSMFTG